MFLDSSTHSTNNTSASQRMNAATANNNFAGRRAQQQSNNTSTATNNNGGGNAFNNAATASSGSGKSNMNNGGNNNNNNTNANARDDSNNSDFSLDIKKLLDGTETRTTVMVRGLWRTSYYYYFNLFLFFCFFYKVRNIPNKYSQQMLLEEVNVHHSGTYDFFYLPIDFKNRCNVGYCFINFLDPKLIPAFIEEFVGQRWKSFNSEKVCTITLARIQGKNAMISRFQNSSLLDKDAEYKPLLFYSTGPEAGKPEPFPASTRAPNTVSSNNNNNNNNINNNSSNNSGMSTGSGKSYSPSPSPSGGVNSPNMMYVLPMPPPGMHSPNNQMMNAMPGQYPPHHHHHHQQPPQQQQQQQQLQMQPHHYPNHPHAYHTQMQQMQAQAQPMQPPMMHTATTHNGIPPPAPGLTVIHEESVSPTSFASPVSTTTSSTGTPSNNTTVTA